MSDTSDVPGAPPPQPQSSPPAEPAPPTPARILAAATRRIRTAGLVRLSMQDVADEAGVSKGLIHYHFRDRDALLARLIEWLGERILERERRALDDCPPSKAIDALWRWIDAELARGELRVLLEVQHDPSPQAAMAARRAARLRHAQAEETTARLFAMLGLQPRVPPELMAGAVVALLDGLALESPLTPEREPRVAFDVAWLAILNLAE